MANGTHMQRLNLDPTHGQYYGFHIQVHIYVHAMYLSKDKTI